MVAYASKTLFPPECKYSNCEKALLCTVWAIQHFSNYIGALKVIIETRHLPVTFLNSQRIRDGMVTNARIATWLMTLQGWDSKARYAQNYKSSIGNGLVACQNCSTDTLYTSEEPKELPQPQLKTLSSAHSTPSRICSIYETVFSHMSLSPSLRQRLYSFMAKGGLC